MNTSNPRGYAFVALDRSYERLCSWNWFAAQRRTGIAMNKKEYIEIGLGIYDRMIAGHRGDPEEYTKAIMQDIVHRLTRTAYTDGQGRIGYERSETGWRAFPRYDLFDTQDEINLLTTGVAEPGFAEIEAADEFTARVQRLFPDLGETERAVVLAFVELGGDASQSEVGRFLGVSRFVVHEALKRIREKDFRTRRAAAAWGIAV